MTESAAEQNAKRNSSGRKKIKKRQIGDDETPSETPQDKSKEVEDQADFEEDKEDLEDESNLNDLNNKMSIEELEARMKEIEKKIASKGKSRPGGDRKRDAKRHDKE